MWHGPLEETSIYSLDGSCMLKVISKQMYSTVSLHSSVHSSSLGIEEIHVFSNVPITHWQDRLSDLAGEKTLHLPVKDAANSLSQSNTVALYQCSGIRSETGDLSYPRHKWLCLTGQGRHSTCTRRGLQGKQESTLAPHETLWPKWLIQSLGH